MKNMTPVLLGLLMLTSFFAGVDIFELENKMDIGEAGARSGADPSVLAVTSPKETTCDAINGCRNALSVGDEVTFTAYIQNAGDADITELSYSVSIYLADLNGNPGNLLDSWTNEYVMCDDGSICEFDSSVAPLSAGSYLGGGKLTLKDASTGEAIVWTPTQGQYVVEVSVSGPEDADISNNNQLVYVVVEDWFDVEVDLAWTSGSNPDVLNAASLTSGEFTLTVTANGSDTFSPRSVRVRVIVTGDVTSATLDGTDVNSALGVIITVGSDATVRTFEHESDPTNFTEETRSVLTYQSAWEASGELVPNGDSEATFEITAELVDYVEYGPFSACEEVIDDGQGNTSTLRHSCEVTTTNDDRPKTDYDEIIGSKITYDDIRISRMGVYQGYNYDEDCTGTASTFNQNGIGGDLNVGCGLVYAEVEHRGSDSSKGYNWWVNYTISHDTLGQVAAGTVNDCATGLSMPYTHLPLGGQGNLVGSACVFVKLSPGEYTFDFTLVMDTKGDENGIPPWDGAANGDARLSNNHVNMVADVVNNLPFLTSFELVTEGDIVVGQSEMLQFAVTAFDVDDPSGDGLYFSYNYQGGAINGCGGNLLAGGSTCSTPVLNAYIGNLVVTVIVTDAHSGEVSQEMSIVVWNDAVASATTDSGITIEYPLQYFALSSFDIGLFEDLDIANYASVQLAGFSGTYAAVAAMDYSPSTTYAASDILSQSLSISFDSSLGATSLWYIDGSGKWILLSDDALEVDATTEMFTYNIPINSPVLPAGKMILMGGQLAQAQIPDASVSGFSALAQKGGAIALAWDISGTMLSSDNIVVTICEAEDDCASPFTQNVGDTDRSFTYSGAQTTHGESYFIEVAVCNEVGCSTPGLATVVADKKVDGDVLATGLTVSVDGQNWVLTWVFDGNDSDVAMWHVCYQRGGSGFDVANMPSDCPDSVSGGDARSMSIAMPTIAGSYEYYFTVVPMDKLGNMNAAASMNSINYFREADNSNVDDGNGTIGDNTDSTASGVPTWTWGLIGGVVIVAFVAGAFILSRGEGGDGGEGKDWDY